MRSKERKWFLWKEAPKERLLEISAIYDVKVISNKINN